MKFIKYNVLAKSHSLGEFLNHVRALGLEVEYKKGVPIGIRDVDNKLYTWKKLEISSKDFQMLEQREQMKRLHNRLNRLEALQQVRNIQAIEQEKNQDRTE